jgi:TonB family protein
MFVALAQTDDGGEEVFVFDDEIEIEIVDDEDGLDKMPELVEYVAAPYPEELVGEGITGTVLLELLVSEAGTVDSASVARSLHPLLDSLALAAARQLIFSPAEADGEPVAVLLYFEYDFAPPNQTTVAVVDGGVDTDDVGIDHVGIDHVGIDHVGTDHTSIDRAGTDHTDIDRAGTDAIGIDLVGTNDVSTNNVSTDGISTNDISTDDDHALDLDDSFELTVYGREEVREVARHRIAISEVRRIPGLGNDAARAVQAMPGVARPRFGGTDVAVRGAPRWASRYFIDGMTVPLLYHVAGNHSIYPSDALEGIDFYPGGFSSRYGGAVGGVIEMRPRRPKTDRLQGYVDLNILDGAVFVEGPVSERVSFMASGRRGFTGELLTLYFKYAAPENMPLALAPFYWDYLLRTDYAIDDRHHLYVSLLGSRDSVGVFIPSMDRGADEIGGEPDRLNMMITFHTVTAGLDSRLSDRLQNSLRLSGTWAGGRMSIFGMAATEESHYITHLRNQISYRAGDALTLNLGADVELMNANMYLTTTSGQNMIVRDTVGNSLFGIAGGYATVEWKPVDRLLLVPSVRFDHYPELAAGNSNIPAFRMNARYEAVDGHTVKAAAGTYSKTPEPMGMVINETWGEIDMPATKATQYVAGYEWRISDLLSLDVQTYYNRMRDVARMYDGRIDFDPLREVQRRWLSDGRDRTYGLELMLRHSRSQRFFGWASYTLSRSETWSKLDDKWILSSRDEPHHLQLLGSWKLPKEWDIGVRARFVSGKPTSPIVGTTESENNKGIGPVYGERNSARHDPFFQVDLRLDRTIEGPRYKLTIYVDLQNALWPIYKSPELTLWNYNYTERQKIGMIPLITTGARLEF